MTDEDAHDDMSSCNFQLSNKFSVWLKNLGETARDRSSVGTNSSRLYVSSARKMTCDFAPGISFSVDNQNETKSPKSVDSRNPDEKSLSFGRQRTPSSDCRLLLVDAQTQTNATSEEVKQTVSCWSEASPEVNSLPDVINSSSSSGQSQPTSPDVLLSGSFKEDVKSDRKCMDPPPWQQSRGQCALPFESQSSDSSNAKERMMSCGYATQGSKLSELSSAGSFDDDIFTPLDNREPINLWKLQPSSSSSDRFPSSETLVTVCGKDERENAETGYGNRQQDLRKHRENFSTEANISRLADYMSDTFMADQIDDLHFDRDMHAELTDLAKQLIRNGQGISSVELQLQERMDSLSREKDEEIEQIIVQGEGDKDDEDEMEVCWTQFLQMAVSCGSTDCDVPICRFFQSLLIDIEMDLRNHTLRNSFNLHHKILLSVVDHSAFCSEIQCNVPWCFFFYCCDLENPEERLSQLMSHYRSVDFGIKKMISPQISNTEFLQFDPDIRWPSVDDGRNVVPTHGLDFEVLSPAGDFGRISYYAQTTTIPPKLLFIQMHSVFDGIHVWNRLRHLRHPNVVKHLWAYVSCKRVVVCSEVMTFGEMSLKELLKENENRLPMKSVLHFMIDILSAVQFLNENNILYLLWIVDSIGIISENKAVQLRDFSCAVDKSRLGNDEEVVDMICSGLPTIIIPPEMFINDIGEFSEIWGLGCLLFHLTTGSCVNRHLLHEDNDFVRREIQHFSTASCLNFLNNATIRSILSQVFVEKSLRLSITQLQNLLTASAIEMQQS